MNQQKLIQRLAELSGMARAIMIVSTDTPAETIADVMEDVLDDGRLRVMWHKDSFVNIMPKKGFIHANDTNPPE